VFLNEKREFSAGWQARQAAQKNSCFSFGNTTLQPGPPLSVIYLQHRFAKCFIVVKKKPQFLKKIKLYAHGMRPLHFLSACV